MTVLAGELSIEEIITAEQARAEVKRRTAVSEYMTFASEKGHEFWTNCGRYRDQVGETVVRRIMAITEYVEKQGRQSDYLPAGG